MRAAWHLLMLSDNRWRWARVREPISVNGRVSVITGLPRCLPCGMSDGPAAGGGAGGAGGWVLIRAAIGGQILQSLSGPSVPRARPAGSRQNKGGPRVTAPTIDHGSGARP